MNAELLGQHNLKHQTIMLGTPLIRLLWALRLILENALKFQATSDIDNIEEASSVDISDKFI